MKNFSKDQYWTIIVIVCFIAISIVSAIGYYQKNEFIYNTGKYLSMIYAIIILVSLFINRNKRL